MAARFGQPPGSDHETLAAAEAAAIAASEEYAGEQADLEMALALAHADAEEAAAAAAAAHAEAVGVAEAKVGALEKTCAGHVHDMSETCP